MAASAVSVIVAAEAVRRLLSPNAGDPRIARSFLLERPADRPTVNRDWPQQPPTPAPRPSLLRPSNPVAASIRASDADARQSTMTAYAGPPHAARLVYSLQKLPDDRNSQDLLAICNYLLHCGLFDSLPTLSNPREPQPPWLYKLGRTARYESHAKNTVLYRQGELGNCWYVLLSGLVFIEGRMYSPGHSFGRPEPGISRRRNDCLVLESSEMLVLPSESDPAVLRSGEPGMSVTLPIAMGVPASAVPPSLSVDTGSSAAAELAIYKSMPMQHQQLISLTQQFAAFSDSSSSSVHSAGSISAEDVDVDLTMNDSLIDSDEEDSYAESTVSSRDCVRDALEKAPPDRTQDDIENLLDFTHNLPAFANMTMATRRALCAVMVFAVVEKAGTMVINDGEELDSWSAIVNGKVEVLLPDGSVKTLQMGDSFGIQPSKEKMLHKGIMKTVVDNCEFVCIAQDDYYAILNEGVANTHFVVENDEAVLVTEARVLGDKTKQGVVVIRGTPEKLIKQLAEDPSPVDPTYVEDFLLTYRTFLPNPLIVANQLIEWFKENKPLRSKVTRIMLLWVNNHFNDFESYPELMDALHNFEQLLLDEQSMLGQLRMLHLACQAKARLRTVVVTRNSRDDTLPFAVSGCSDDGRPAGSKLFVVRVDHPAVAAGPSSAGAALSSRGASGQELVGLRRGDQLIEVNGLSLLDIDSGTSTSPQAIERAKEMLMTAKHLQITVRSNLLDFHHMVTKAEGPQKAFAVRNAGINLIKLNTVHAQPSDDGGSGNSGGADNEVPADSNHRPVISANKKHKDGRSKDKTATMSHSSKEKFLKALKHMKLIPKGSPIAPLPISRVFTGQDSTDGCSLSRPRSNSDPDIKGTLQRSNSSPDVAGGLAFELGKGLSTYGDQVLKIYKADQTCKYLLVNKDTTARDVVVMALRHFGISDHGSNLNNITCHSYSLCEVSVEEGGLVKQKRLPETVSNLAEKIGVHSRYYLKNNMSQEPLITDEAAVEMSKEGRFTFLTLSSQEIAMQLSIADYAVFQQVEATEYVDELCSLRSRYGCAQLQKFTELINRETFWVVTEVCKECNVVRRAKTLKHFIKIARYCKEYRNFNSTFAILSGLNYGAVSRLRATWDRLPSKYLKMFTDLDSILDPTRNMAKYRSLLSSFTQPPVIPFYPIVKKDLTFIHLGNDTRVDGLINFEKMRMISKEVRQICRLASSQYNVSDMQYGMSSSSVFHGFADASSEANVSGFVTTRRKKRGSQLLQPKRIFEEAQMARWVRAYLASLVVERDEDRLLEMSFKCEPNRRMETSSQGSTLSVGSNSSMGSSSLTTASSGSTAAGQTAPKFGSASPEAVRKLMSLSEGTKPVNPKKRHPQQTGPSAAPAASGGMSTLQPSPLLGLRSNSAVLGGTVISSSQATAAQLRSVDLSSESSSVVSLGSLASRMSRRTSTSSGISSGTSGYRDTPQEIRKFSQHGHVPPQPERDNDSGHCSLASSSCCDAQSMCSLNSISIGSPVMLQRHSAASLVTMLPGDDGAAVVTAAHRRPPLPSYEALMRESVAGAKLKPAPRELASARGGVVTTRHSAASLPAYVVRAHGVERFDVGRGGNGAGGGGSAGPSQVMAGGQFDTSRLMDDEEGVVSMV